MKRILSRHKTFSSAIRRPRIAFAVSGVALAAVIWLGATVGREFLPELDEGSIWLQVQMPAGISLTKATEMGADLRTAVLEFPEVSYIVTQLDRNDDGTDPWTPSHRNSFSWSDRLPHGGPGLLKNHLVGTQQNRFRHRQAQRLGSLGI